MQAGLAMGLTLALGSGLSSAIAHWLLKSGDSKTAVQAWSRLIIAAIFLPAAWWIGWPPAALWPWLIAAVTVHTLYYLTLIWSYSINDFSAAYPIARGCAPIFTTFFGLLLLRDQLDHWTIFGILTIALGIFHLGDPRQIPRAGLIAAICSGLMTSGYTLIDAAAIRAAPSALIFIVWLFVLDGIAMPALLFLRHRAKAFTLLRQDAKPGILAGLASPFAFVPMLLALNLAPAGAVSAIRETSVLFGVVLGRVMLKEQVKCRRAIGAVLVTCGALLIMAQALL